MSTTKYTIKLTDEERIQLRTVATGKKGRLNIAAWKVTRAKALLKIDRGEQGPAWTDKKAAEALSSISALRQLDPKKLTTTIRGELDWIVMKALEKDRSRRYESASAFAADIQRYLDHEPVKAGPPTARYRLRKLVRKHRGLFATGATFALLLVLATAITTWQAIRATRAETIADERLAEAVEHRDAAQASRSRAISYLRDNLNIVSGMLERGAAVSEDGESATDVLRAQKNLAVRQFEKYAQAGLRDSSQRLVAGIGYVHLAKSVRALGNEDKPEDEEFRYYHDAIAIFSALAEEFPNDHVHWLELGQAQGMLGERQYDNGDLQSARTSFVAAHRSLFKCLSLAPDDRAKNIVAWALVMCPDPRFRDAGRAIMLAEEAVKNRPEHSGYLNTLGVAYYHGGEYERAIAILHKSNDFALDGKTRWLNNIVLALSYKASGNTNRARQSYEDARLWIERHGTSDSDTSHLYRKAIQVFESKDDVSE